LFLFLFLAHLLLKIDAQGGNVVEARQVKGDSDLF
jgi:hypothetical protein